MKSVGQSAAVRRGMREMTAQIGQLNRRVAARAGLRDADIAVLDCLGRNGPMSPTAVARSLNLHPATLTGLLDRLEADGWLERRADPADRRAVELHAVPARARELAALYAPMNGEIDRIVAGCSEEERRTIANFLDRVTEAAQRVGGVLAQNRK